MRLTAHFRSEEFACHDGTPVPEHALKDLERLCQRYLEPLRAAYGPVSIVSGYRHRAYNVRIGGAPESYHIYQADRPGVAADCRCAEGSPASWHRTLAELDPGGLGRYPAHVHVDNRRGRARW